MPVVGDPNCPTYGIAVFDYEPCGTDGKTTITFR
jgi:hypothetical protein